MSTVDGNIQLLMNYIIMFEVSKRSSRYHTHFSDIATNLDHFPTQSNAILYLKLIKKDRMEDNNLVNKTYMVNLNE